MSSNKKCNATHYVSTYIYAFSDSCKIYEKKVMYFKEKYQNWEFWRCDYLEKMAGWKKPIEGFFVKCRKNKYFWEKY